MRSSLAAFALLLSASCLLVEAGRAQKAAPDLFAASRNARAGGRFGMLLRQFKADEAALPEHHEAGWKEATATYQGARDIPAGFWVWQRPYWFVFRDGPDRAAPQRQWGPEAACAAPDTPQPGHNGSAWASKEQDEKGDWLLLEYEQPVRATALLVHENFNPGAVAAVGILTPQGEELELWRNREVKAATEPGRVLQIDLPLGFDVERVKLTLASEAVPGWNEIDAVGLRDDKGKVHWASRAEASSTYADSTPQQALQGAFRAVWLRQQVALPRIQLQAPRALNLQVETLQRAAQQARQVQLDVQPLLRVAQQRRVQFGAIADESPQLRERITELENRVKQLEDELARAKARK